MENEESTPKDKKAPNTKGAFYALTFRNFRLFFIGQLISVSGVWMQTLAQSWLIFDLTHSAAWLGVIAGVKAIPNALLSIWGGQVADRYPRRTILVITKSSSMALSLLLATLATNWWTPIRPWEIAAISLLSGVVSAFNQPAQRAFIVDIVEDRDALGNAIALNSFRVNIARFIGLILAGVTLSRFGAPVCFLLNGVSFLAVIISLLMMRIKRKGRMESKAPIWGGFKYIWRDKTILRIVAVIGLGSIFVRSSTTIFPIFAARMHAGAGGYSAMMTANGLGAMLGSIAFASFGSYLPRKTAIYGGAALFSVGLILFSITHIYPIALGILVMSGFANIVFNVSANTKIQEDVPEFLRGRVMAVYALVFGGMMPVGGLETGFLAQEEGGPLALQINSLICLIAVCITLVWSGINHPPSNLSLNSSRDI